MKGIKFKTSPECFSIEKLQSKQPQSLYPWCHQLLCGGLTNMIYSDEATLRNTVVKIEDAVGLVQQMTQFPHALNTSKLPAGVYYLRFNNGTDLRLVQSE